ncbi:hypothetical protein BD289DRAFT_433384 [Coniella lustricola]|uniref:Uncharacterized protein n=1 Tax=Coniella lustricola TaxID=2025994 RepID=A0A2T3A8L6_9PEZI|nr:hypothetical protein BD289DRAFT_433384 [Coniella lustricola]
MVQRSKAEPGSKQRTASFGTSVLRTRTGKPPSHTNVQTLLYAVLCRAARAPPPLKASRFGEQHPAALDGGVEPPAFCLRGCDCVGRSGRQTATQEGSDGGRG